jgi:F0F1-type ATP synthase alpha subunit
VEKQIVAIYAGNAKLFINVPVARVTEAEEAFVSFLDANYSKMLSEIKKSGLLTDANKQDLGKAMDEFRAAHAELFTV